ncbi:MAG TPA: immunoglobulin domain-containing protein [Verrucomicrobiae bacterium]|nr:immunoglobulin domain-containing protein [Verrucomicrobiae bacterium]
MIAVVLSGVAAGFSQPAISTMVGAAPVITGMTVLTNATVNYGEKLVLGVTAMAPAGKAFPLMYRWQRNGSRIVLGRSSNIVVTVMGAQTYSVSVSNAWGGTNVSWSVKAFYPGGVLIPQQPENQYAPAGSQVTFMGSGTGSNAVAFEWRFNGKSLPGATNAWLTLSGVTEANEGTYNYVVSDGVHFCMSSNVSFTLVRAPVVPLETMGMSVECAYGHRQVLATAAKAEGMANGFPLEYHWQHEGTNMTGVYGGSYAFSASEASAGEYSVTIANAAGSVRKSWRVSVTEAVNVTNDLLLIYNTNSADSRAVLNYYLIHRPNVRGANVLGVGYENRVAPGYYEPVTPADLTNCILNPVAAWLAAHPGKLPQYVVLFPDLPSRVCRDAGVPFSTAGYGAVRATACVGMEFRNMREDWRPYVTYLNMGMGSGNGRADCIAYINKLERLGKPVSAGSAVLSASAGGYGNTNYMLDGVRALMYGNEVGVVAAVTNDLLAAGVAPGAIRFYDGVLPARAMHGTAGTNMAGYVSWGANGGISAVDTTNGVIAWHGNSGWYLMQTMESFNGQEIMLAHSQGSFTFWFSNMAFGGTHYANTPVGAVSSVEEPTLGGKNNNPIYFGSWARGKFFAICAWESINYSPFFMATGDPLVVR